MNNLFEIPFFINLLAIILFHKILRILLGTTNHRATLWINDTAGTAVYLFAHLVNQIFRNLSFDYLQDLVLFQIQNDYFGNEYVHIFTFSNFYFRSFIWIASFTPKPSDFTDNHPISVLGILQMITFEAIAESKTFQSFLFFVNIKPKKFKISKKCKNKKYIYFLCFL